MYGPCMVPRWQGGEEPATLAWSGGAAGRASMGFVLRHRGVDYRQRVRLPDIEPGVVPSDRTDDALLAAAIDAIEDAYRDGGGADRLLVLTQDDVVAASETKKCRYQQEADGDWWCAAPRSDGADPRPLGPDECWTCAVPDERVACDRWRGATVRTATLPDARSAREVVSVNCAVACDAGECVPGGGTCWLKQVRVVRRSIDTEVGAR